jgi:predicted AlkP superfamily phosphohydrolase/phosphomutase
VAAKRVLVLGLDGLPHSLAGKLTTAGVMPNLGRLLSQGSSLRMRTVIPTISNVAWGCFLTGKNPGKTGVYGFAELDERSSFASRTPPTSRSPRSTTSSRRRASV